jgi:hypothetical protein
LNHPKKYNILEEEKGTRGKGNGLEKREREGGSANSRGTLPFTSLLYIKNFVISYRSVSEQDKIVPPLKISSKSNACATLNIKVQLFKNSNFITQKIIKE